MWKRNQSPLCVKKGRCGPSFIQAGLVLAITLGLCMGLSGVLYADECDFVRVNNPGFDLSDPSEDFYAWAMTAYTDASGHWLYVTTNNTSGGRILRLPVDTVTPLADYPGLWKQVLDTEGTGNSGIRNIAALPNGAMFAGTSHQFAATEGCQLWYSPDGAPGSFEMVVGDDPEADPVPVLGPGFGNTNNQSVRGLQAFITSSWPYMYIGLQKAGGGTGELWRTDGVPNPDGTLNFEELALPSDMGGSGSGNSSMHTMAVYDPDPNEEGCEPNESCEPKLLLATKNSDGFQIWYTEDGENFCPLVAPREDNTGGGGGWFWQWWQNRQGGGGGGGGGGWFWRWWRNRNNSATTTAQALDPQDFEGCPDQIEDEFPILPGFGHSDETTPLDIHVDGDHLLIGTAKPTGFGIFRLNLAALKTGDLSEASTQPTTIEQEGLGDPLAYYAWRFESFQGYIYLSNYNYGPLTGGGTDRAALYRSGDDGDTWEMVMGDAPSCLDLGFGFNSDNNYGIRSFAVVDPSPADGDSIMFLGTATCPPMPEFCPEQEGAEVWALQEWLLP